MTDAKTLLFDAQAITNTNVLSSTIDLGSMTNVGEGGDKFVEVWVQTPFTEDSSGEYIQIDLVASTGAAPDTTDWHSTIFAKTAVSTGSPLLSTGLLCRQALPSKMRSIEQIGLAVLVTETLAAGKLTAFIVTK